MGFEVCSHPGGICLEPGASAALAEGRVGAAVPWALPSLSPLTHHLCPQLIINEAAAQFCLRDNSLLLRRVELFSLSRQVARESTYLSSLKVAR